MTLADFNAMDDGAARERLLVCLDVPRWADAVAAGRPYSDAGEVEAAMAAASAASAASRATASPSACSASPAGPTSPASAQPVRTVVAR